MSFYNTGNPVPSDDPRDLDDNAKIIDVVATSTELSTIDRKGRAIRTLAGLQYDASQGTLRTDLASAIGATLVSFTQSPIGAVVRTLQEKGREILSVYDFGLIGDRTNHPVSEWYTPGFSAYRGYANLAAVQVDYPHVTSATQTIDWAAGQAALNYTATVPSILNFNGAKCVLSDSLVWKGGAIMRGHEGVSELMAADGANCTVLKSDNIAYWKAWTSGSNAGYTLNGGIDGLTINGNAAFQGDVSTTEENLIYGMHIHSHRFGIGWLQVRSVKGVGILTEYNAALMYSFRTDGVDDYGLQGSPLGSPSPFQFGNINVIDCLYEHFVFKGPADIPIWHLTTNYCGWLDNATIPTTPRTSLLFPGQEIHSVRIETACKVGYANLNGALYGRSLYVAGFTRFQGDSIICTGSWGACKIEGSAFGCISSLMIQQNSFAWGGVYKPGLEGAFGTGSAANKSKMTISHVGIRRLTTPVTANAIGPAILDNAGLQLPSIDGVDSAPVAGHGLVIGSTNRGGMYGLVNFDSIQGLAGDGQVSCAVRFESGARDWRIENLRLTGCDRGVVNLGTNMRGTIVNAVIEVNRSGATGQVALEGVVGTSQLASVVPGTGNIAAENLPDWNVEINDNDVRYYNKFKGLTTFNTGSIANLTSAVIPHKMWRAPSSLDCQVTPAWGGATPPAVTLGVRSVTATDVTLFCKVTEASAGTLTAILHVR